MNDRIDRLYQGDQAPIGGFRFDQQVARVFPDMIRRSVPGYAMMLDMIRLLTARFAQPASTLYDLGCALGASTLAMRAGLDATDGCKLVGVDNSQDMLDQAQRILATEPHPQPVSFVCADVCDLALQPCSVVTLHFTLQFVPPAQRVSLLQGIYRALLPGGALILSEKTLAPDAGDSQLLSTWHEAFKADQGYSSLEIARKRSALESVLIPESLETHRQRLLQAGFSRVLPWFQCFNFHSLVALR